MKKQNGLTLIELIIVVTILGIMAAIATPNFGSMMQRSKLKTSYNTFVGILSTARAEAVNRSTPITVCVTTDKATCVAAASTKTWSDGYMAFLDIDRNGLRDNASTSEEEILVYEPPTSGLIITSEDYKNAITMVSRGRLQSEGTFLFCSNTTAESTAKALNLWVTGLGRLATDGNDVDDIVEGADGDNIDCSP